MKTTQYSKEEKEEIIRDYFGPPGTEENPRCPTCGEVLRLDGLHDSGSGQFRLEVSCPDCKASFSWQQNYLQQPWKELHLQYFVERYTTHEPIRCPLDDCYVIYTEFTDRIVEFRCPYCNHRGKAQIENRIRFEFGITNKSQILNSKSQTNHKSQAPNHKQTQYKTVRETTLSEVLNLEF